MLKRDYILAMVQEIAKVLARMMGLKLEGKYREALELAYHTLDHQFKLTTYQLTQFNAEKLLSYLQDDCGYGDDTISSIADLLIAQGELEQIQHMESCTNTLRQALYLLEWVDAKQINTYSFSRKSNIQHIKSLLNQPNV